MGQCCASDQGKTTTDGMAPKIQDQGQARNKRTLMRNTKAKQPDSSSTAKNLDSIKQVKEKTPEKMPAENHASNSSAAEDSTSVTTP